MEYTIGDRIKVKVSFTGNGNTTNVSETFEAESINSIEMQKGGWLAILDTFKNIQKRINNLNNLSVIRPDMF